MRTAHGVEAVGSEQGGGNDQQSHDLARAQAVFAEYFQNVGQERDSGAEQHQADDVERVVALLAVVGQMPIDHVQPAQADRNVDEEDDAPMKIRNDQAAQQRSEHWPDQARNGNEAHGVDELGF